MNTPVDEMVEAISNARMGNRRSSSAWIPESRAQAYAVQTRVAALTGEVAGFKTARKPGQPQIMAPIFARDVLPSGACVASRFGGHLGVELEVGLRLEAPLPAPDSLDFAARAAACLRPVAVIEIVDTRLEGARADAALAKLADNQINAGLIVGPEMAAWNGGQLSRVTARMQAGDACLLYGEADVPGGCAVDTLAALAAMIGDHCGGLQPGQIIITGSLHPLTYVAPGTLVEGEIDSFGAVRVQIG